MIKFIKRIFTNNKSSQNKEKQTPSIDKPMDIINVSTEQNIIQIKILANCTLEDFSNACLKHNIETIKIPMRMYIKEGNDNQKLQKQKIYYLKRGDKIYILSKNDNQIKLTQQKTTEDNIEETTIHINIYPKSYKIYKYLHDLNHSTVSTKWYPNNSSSFVLEEKEAFLSAYKLLMDAEDDKIDYVVNLEKIYSYLDLVEKYRYFPVISDGDITLSWPFRFAETDINKRDYEIFDIILNKTKQIIGNISFDYRTSEGFTYGGNVAYSIKEEFRGNHYATKALALLKKLLISNLFEGDKDLYIATTPENYKSQKVVLNNNGELFYKGSVPEDDSLNYIDGVEKVTVYRIKM